MKVLLSVLLLLLLGTGCNVINPPEKVPTYIHIDSFHLVPNNPSELTTHNINTAWVYFDNQIVGVYELPANIPVVADNPGQILVNAGVDFTGYSAYKVIYPFYSYDTLDLTPQPGKVINFTPQIRYLPITQLRYQEDFETGNTFEPFNGDIDDDTSLVQTTDPRLTFGAQGGSGYIYLTPGNSYSQNINNTSFPIKVGEAYLEIDYKCSVQFQVGLQTTSAGSPVYESIVTIKPSDEWKKLYIGLQDFISRFKTGSYRVVILAELPDGQQNGYVLIDNIKAISY